MEKQNIYKEVRDLLLQIMETESERDISVQVENQSDLQLDSLSTVSLIILIEEKYNITLDDEDLLFENYGNIEKIAEMISRYI